MLDIFQCFSFFFCCSLVFQLTRFLIHVLRRHKMCYPIIVHSKFVSVTVTFDADFRIQFIWRVKDQNSCKSQANYLLCRKKSCMMDMKMFDKLFNVVLICVWWVGGWVFVCTSQKKKNIHSKRAYLHRRENFSSGISFRDPYPSNWK